MHPWEASPYANVHKYNHDVLPAHAALGMNGCTDCHHPDSAFFFASTVKYIFDENAQPVTQPQYRLLGLSLPAVRIGCWREAYLKPVTYGMIVALCLGIVAMAGGMALRWTFEPRAIPAAIRVLPAMISVSGGIVAHVQPRFQVAGRGDFVPVLDHVTVFALVTCSRLLRVGILVRCVDRRTGTLILGLQVRRLEQ